MGNKYYIIRGDRSGVFFGQIAGRNGQEVELRWTGKRRPEVDLYPAQMKLRFEKEEAT